MSLLVLSKHVVINFYTNKILVELQLQLSLVTQKKTPHSEPVSPVYKYFGEIHSSVARFFEVKMTQSFLKQLDATKLRAIPFRNETKNPIYVCFYFFIFLETLSDPSFTPGQEKSCGEASYPKPNSRTISDGKAQR